MGEDWLALVRSLAIQGDPVAFGRVARLVTGYLNIPMYRAYHEWLGRPGLEAMWAAWDAGDRRAALDAVPTAAVDDLIVHGTAEQRRAAVERFYDAGVDTMILLPTSAEPDATAHREAIVTAMRDQAPGR